MTQYGKNDRAGERGAASPCGQLHQTCAPGLKPSLAGGKSRNEGGKPSFASFGQSSDGQTQAGLLLAPVGTPWLEEKFTRLAMFGGSDDMFAFSAAIAKVATRP